MATDFPTALARLLKDRALRERFAADPQGVVAELQVSQEEGVALAGLRAEDLEYQAEILLRKRFESIQRFMGETVANLGADAFATFRHYAEAVWPEGDDRELNDALAFQDYLSRNRPQAVNPLVTRRLAFRHGTGRMSLHWSVTGVTLFLRQRTGWIREWKFFLRA